MKILHNLFLPKLRKGVEFSSPKKTNITPLTTDMNIQMRGSNGDDFLMTILKKNNNYLSCGSRA